jgi:hypothetical protein
MKRLKEAKTDMCALKVSFVPYVLSVVLSGHVLCGLSEDYLNGNCQSWINFKAVFLKI